MVCVEGEPAKHGCLECRCDRCPCNGDRDWVVEGKITSETEIRASIRNTNDRLRRLRHILYPPGSGTRGRKSPRVPSVEEHHKISTKDFARALLADRRKK